MKRLGIKRVVRFKREIMELTGKPTYVAGIEY